MNYRIETIPVFDKQVKKLSKKYPSFKNDLYKLSLILKNNPFKGVALGNDCYKIRLAISSKGKGKSKGARVITHVFVIDEVVHMLYVYDKSSVVNISDDKIKELLSNIL